MDHSLANNNASMVFHGLVKAYSFNSRTLSALASAKKPSTFLKVGGSSLALFFPQDTTLLGADSTPTAGTQTVEVSNAITAGSTLRAVFRAILIREDYYDVVCEYTIQSGATLTTAAQGWKGVINVSIAGSGTITNGRIYVVGLADATKSEIGTGMALKYAAVTGSGAVLTFNGASSGGTVQNSYDFTVEVLPKAPGLLTLASDNLYNIAGLEYFGATGGATANFQGTENKVETAQSYQPLDTYITATAADLSFDAIEDLNPRVLRKVQQISGFASTDSYEITIPNFFSAAPSSGLLLQYEAPGFPGIQQYGLFRNIRGNNLQLVRDKTHKPIQAKFAIIQPDNADDICYFTNYRPSIAA